MNHALRRLRSLGLLGSAGALLWTCAMPALSAPAANAGPPVRAIERKDPMRRTLMEALRPAVERDLGQKVIFVVHVLRSDGQWAFASVSPRTPAGGPIDFLRTRHADRQRAGMLDGDIIHALLRRNAAARWRVVTFLIGPTDVPWASWPEEHGAPRALFRLPD